MQLIQNIFLSIKRNQFQESIIHKSPNKNTSNHRKAKAVFKLHEKSNFSKT